MADERSPGPFPTPEPVLRRHPTIPAAALATRARVSPTLPDASPPSGSVYFGVLVDDVDGLEELDESNNHRSRPVTVTAGEGGGM